jgi:hypothetical protein
MNLNEIQRQIMKIESEIKIFKDELTKHEIIGKYNHIINLYKQIILYYKEEYAVN